MDRLRNDSGATGRLRGVFIGQVRASDLTGRGPGFFAQVKGLMAAAPFQFRSEMLFMTRAWVFFRASLTPSTRVDAWNETAPFAQRLIQEDFTKGPRSLYRPAAGRAPQP